MIYRYAFNQFEYGYACAISIFLVAISLLATVIINRVFGKESITY
jgi:raffinose/stachyose/melibiose transport system permease protein